MAATREEIHTWLLHGKRDGATHVIIACDTFSWEDYPLFVKPEHQVQEIVAKLDGKNMQRVMEVYDLALDIDAQLNEWNLVDGKRAWHL